MLQIGIVGDFNSDSLSHRATSDAIQHAAAALGIAAEAAWQPTLELAGTNGQSLLDRFDGLWIASGSPYKSMGGALTAIRFARERGRPLLAT